MRVVELDPIRSIDLHALRDAVVLETDASVRRAALLQLDEHAARALLPYVRDATRDRAAAVREAAFVVLARARDLGSLSRATNACLYDRSFRVRRMATLFAASTFRERALPVLALASRDPFWRVRVSARRAGASLDATIDLTAMRGLQVRVDLPNELDDPDPAVATVKVAAVRATLPAEALVGALGHSHLALRRIAVTEVARRGDERTLRLVARWFADERIPYGPDAAEAALRRSCRGHAVAEQLVSECEVSEPGALAWAIGAAERAPPWPQLASLLRHEDARVRRAAASRVAEAAPDRATLFSIAERLLADGDEEVQLAAGGWLAATSSRDAAEILRRCSPDRQPTAIRTWIVEARRALRDTGGLRALVDDAHAGVRASALAALSSLDALTRAEARALASDTDPWIRLAVLAPHGAALALHDPVPLVRGAALEHLEDESVRAVWAASVDRASEPEPALRARAADILGGATTDDATRALLRLARDPDLGVRSAATSALDAHRGAVARLLGSRALGVDERIAAHTLLWLGGEPCFSADDDPRVAAHIALLDNMLSGRPPVVPAPMAEAPLRLRAKPHTRALGRTGIAVAPFGISGANGLGCADLAMAYERGVNLFFWEPSHEELARFVRGVAHQGIVMVAGSYHADAASIERDLYRALRVLRRDTIDVFLAFWTRSAARIDHVTEPLLELRRRNLARAVGVSTHDRALACLAVDRGLDVVMVRHSAAHRGAETSVFPHCAARGASVLTFSNLCYGRMLHRTGAALSAGVTAADCYRYSLSQAGVHACIAAPRRYSELLADLEVLEDPSLRPSRARELQEHGALVYARSKAWSAETWSVGAELTPLAREEPETLRDWFERPESISPDR
jgi:HEAT repeat protein